MKGSKLFVQELMRQGVPYIATLCGHGLNDLHNACEEAGLPMINVRNEQSAGYIADSTGRLSRKVGVCAVSSGVAHANAMTGVVNAHFDGAPMLLITGSASTQTMGLAHFQDLDQVALAAPVCKYSRIVDDAERIPQLVHEAFSAALSGRPGPVHLTLPMNVQSMHVDSEKIVRIPAPPVSELPRSLAPGDQIERITKLLSQSKRPLVIAGSGVYYSQGEKALSAFVKTMSIPVVVPIWDRGSITEPIDEFVGVLGAATGGPRLLPDADLIIMMGAAFDYRVGYLQPPAVHRDAQIVRIDLDPIRLQQGVGSHFSIQADPCSVLRQLSEACNQLNVSPHTEWLDEARKRKKDFRDRCLRNLNRTNDALTALDIMEAVQHVLTDDTVLVVDGGNIGQWFHQILADRYPGHWLTCGASGVVGFGLPGAMAARKLYPDRPVILVTGDGSIGFTIIELESAARQSLNYVVVLADDEAWGITYTAQENQFGHPITSELGPAEYDLVAKGLGANGVRVEKAKDIEPAIREAISDNNRPTLIQVPIAKSNPAF
jgi:acetolactate synthase-1/2/3 large subunit